MEINYYDLIKSSDGLRSIIYCIHKNGEYSFSNYTTPELILSTRNFDELKLILVFLNAANEEKVLTEDAYQEVIDNNAILIPSLDRLRRWPWEDGYEVE